MSKTTNTDNVPKKRGRPAGSPNKDQFRVVKISELLSILNEDSAIPVKATFVDAIIGAQQAEVEDLSAAVRIVKDEAKIPVTTHTA